MKRKRLNLDELKVQSFVTELQSEHAYTAKGGDDADTFDGKWGPCIGYTVSVWGIYKDWAKEKSWPPYHCTRSKATSTNPASTMEFDSCMDTKG